MCHSLTINKEIGIDGTLSEIMHVAVTAAPLLMLNLMNRLLERQRFPPQFQKLKQETWQSHFHADLVDIIGKMSKLLRDKLDLKRGFQRIIFASAKVCRQRNLC